MSNTPFFYFDETSAKSLATIIDWAVDMSGTKGYMVLDEDDKRAMRNFSKDLWKIAGLQRVIYAVGAQQFGHGGETLIPVHVPKDFADTLIEMGNQYRKDHS